MFMCDILSHLVIFLSLKLFSNNGLTLPGEIKALNEAQIRARVNGYIKEWKYDIGARVKAGDTLAIIDPLHAEVTSMITSQDIDMLAAQLENNTTAGIMLIENLWAKKTMQAMLAADGRLVMFERIPHDVVEEALADIGALAATEA